MGSLPPPPLAENSPRCGHQPRERISLHPDGQEGTPGLLRPSTTGWKICAVLRPPPAPLETPQFHHQAPLIHLVTPIHTSIWRQMSCLSLSVKVFLYLIPIDPPSRELRILGNQRWLYHVWGVGCPGGEVALTSWLPVSVGFGSGGTEWVGGTISGLHQEKPGKAACRMTSG